MSLSGIYRLIIHSQQIQDYQEDLYIGIKQASQYVIGTRYQDVGNSYQYLDYKDKENELFFEKGRLVKKPGYEIILTNIEDGHFEIADEHIYICFKRDEENYRFLLTYARKIQEDVRHETP